MENKILSLLGLAQKAGKLASGEEPCEQNVRGGKVKLLIIAEDCGFNTRKKFDNMCSFRSVPIMYFSEKETLGKAIGKEYRAVVAVLDCGFARTIYMQYQRNGGTSIDTKN